MFKWRNKNNKLMKDNLQSLIQFLNRSPTAWHAVDEASHMLEKAGFQQIKEVDSWKLKPNGRYFVIRNGSSLAAFITPAKSPTKLHLVGSHTDSPGFKLKPNAEFQKHNLVMLGLEIYGGPLISSWLNRDLGLAGRVIYLDHAKKLQESLVRLDQHPVVIPQLAIHLDREVNEKGLILNKQEQLAAIAGLKEVNSDPSVKDKNDQPYLLSRLKEQLPIQELLSSELFLFPLEPAASIGMEGQLIASYRIDNLVSAHASLDSICKSKPHDHSLNMIVLWDNEEIGSATAQGACSDFFSTLLERIALSLNISKEDLFRLLASSFCISSDLAHATHPNYSDRDEPRHQILLGHGIVIKQDAQQKYASSGPTAGYLKLLCNNCNIATQSFVNRGDMKSGSTLGPLHATATGMPTVDIGIPQLSMHSCRELFAGKDYLDLIKLFNQFFVA